MAKLEASIAIENGKNDHDYVADCIRNCVGFLLAGMLSGDDQFHDYVLIDKHRALDLAIELQRAVSIAQGYADSHRVIQQGASNAGQVK